MCVASRAGLGTVLQQRAEKACKATHFASRFLTTFEQKDSINELELLAVVWAMKIFRNFVYGTHFEIVSDQRALTAILNGNWAKKTYSSRLTRWVDRLLPFQFTVKHEPGRTLEMADYLSRPPSPSNNKNQAKVEELWINWFIVNNVIKVQNQNSILDEQNRQRKTPKPITEEIANESERTEGGKEAIENHLSVCKKRTMKSIIATINANSHSNERMDSNSES